MRECLGDLDGFRSTVRDFMLMWHGEEDKMLAVDEAGNYGVYPKDAEKLYPDEMIPFSRKDLNDLFSGARKGTKLFKDGHLPSCNDLSDRLEEMKSESMNPGRGRGGAAKAAGKAQPQAQHEECMVFD